jgi:hypothetical protein
MIGVKQCVWHSPQLFGSEEMSTQYPPQQTNPSAQALPQAPQLATS